MATINTLLGRRAGVLRLIFLMLSSRDMMNVVQVCRLWREVGEAPSSWTRYLIRVTRQNISKVLESRRIDNINEISLEEKLTQHQMESILANISGKDSYIKILNILLAKIPFCLDREEEEEEEENKSSLLLIDQDLLLKAINRMQVVSIPDNQLTIRQFRQIFRDINNGISHLHKLDISRTNLSRLDPTLLTNALRRLVEVKLDETRLTLEQIEMILTYFSGEGSKPKKLVLSNNDLSLVDPCLLARSVNSLEDININNTNLTEKQVEEIFKGTFERQSRLKKLDIAVNDLFCSRVDNTLDIGSFSRQAPDLLASSVIKLEEVNLRYNNLTAMQLNAIFFAIRNGTSSLKDIDISGNNLSLVWPYTLARGIHKLEGVNVSATKLTFVQTKFIISAISDENSQLKTLDISENNLSKVDPHALSKAMNKLEVAYMENNQLTLLQVESILTQSMVLTALKMLRMTKPQGILNKDLVARARKSKIDIKLDSTDLEHSEEYPYPEDFWDWIDPAGFPGLAGDKLAAVESKNV